ncbi:retron St85 family effector protein [Alishewanella sp. 16-MA]|uniref:Retron St85 family effector protein n=1 Tax=Alishewanella maricola TaxID=2795740 RepID=A0ABS8C7S7_9ALTE|nr:retron St85 family effector protein [Alishewanella maricola]MCB5228385.1 retron St85 family effector protein [Alishewanella maricola]
MDSIYESALFELFSQFDKKQIVIELAPHIIFVCGGPVEVSSLEFTSVRHQFINFLESQGLDQKNNFELVLAESFKDYFKENIYSDLLTFEKDILNISSIAVIILESPGALVELGLFCNNISEIQKLFVVSDSELINLEDSFIFLGPLNFIKEKSASSSLSYPFAGFKNKGWKEVEFICGDFVKKVSDIDKTQSYKDGNSGHLCFVIYEIISLASPILLEEIEMSLLAFDVSFDRKSVIRSIYLLLKLELINPFIYSNFKFYYPVSDHRRAKFVHSKIDKLKDRLAMKVHLKKVFRNSTDEKDYKRSRVNDLINKVDAG